MKYIFTSLLLLLTLSAWSQRGFDLIRKAEAKIEKGRYQKALKLLDRADGSNYVFCGNAWIAADEAIALNRAKVYDQLGESQRAGNEINSIYLTMSYTNFDSLKTAYFINAFGKELVKKEIDSCINSMPRGILDTIHYADNFVFDVNFSEEPFHISFSTLNTTLREARSSVKDRPNADYFVQFKEAIRRQPFYLLLE